MQQNLQPTDKLTKLYYEFYLLVAGLFRIPSLNLTQKQILDRIKKQCPGFYAAENEKLITFLKEINRTQVKKNQQTEYLEKDFLRIYQTARYLAEKMDAEMQMTNKSKVKANDNAV